MPKEKVFIL